ncbi:MAG TPA: hypothetical protein VGO59_07725 [Verrucomicrobiae bacterium]|jgi:hypothetical protein
MKHELELKVQAWVDGELPDVEARRIGQWIAENAEASALASELGCVRRAMSGGETLALLDDSRDFYWSKIQRQIEREAFVPSHDPLPWFARWRRYMAPACGALAMACLLTLSLRQAATPSFDEISSVGEGMEAVTFHDQSAQMTVVWLQNNGGPADNQAAPKIIRYEDEPGTVVDLE